MQITELREYQIEFEKIKVDIKPEYKKIKKLVNNFKKDYPPNKVKLLQLDDYVTGKGDPTTFCNRIENELNNWGNIHGSTAKKFGIYFGVNGDDKDKKYRIGKAIFGSSVENAFENVKLSIIDLLKSKDNVKLLKKSPISPMYKGKILSIYYPDEFLNIFSASHLNHFINILGLENKSKSEIDKQAQLLKFKNNDLVMSKWSVFEFSRFLYKSFGPPDNELKKQTPKELLKFIQKTFPPIELVNAEFVNLQTDKFTEVNTKGSKKFQKKIDYSEQSKRFKRTGDRGEQIVVMIERQRLIDNSRPDLAEKVEQVSKLNDSLGYDIKSYEISGKEKFIEVKSTLKSVAFCNIFISTNELEISKEKNNYYFYIVYDVGSKKPKIWKVKSTDFLNDKNIELQPISYRIGIKTK